MPSKYAFLSLLTAISFASISTCLPQQPANLVQGPQCLTEDALKTLEAAGPADQLGERYEDYPIEGQDLKLRFGSNRRGDIDDISVHDALDLLLVKVLGYPSRPDPASLRAKPRTDIIPYEDCGLVWPPAERRRTPPLQFFVSNQRRNPAFTVDVAIKAIEGYQQWMIRRPSQVIKVSSIMIQKMDGGWVGAMGLIKNPNYRATPVEGTPKECPQNEGCDNIIIN